MIQANWLKWSTAWKFRCKTCVSINQSKCIKTHSSWGAKQKNGQTAQTKQVELDDGKIATTSKKMRFRLRTTPRPCYSNHGI